MTKRILTESLYASSCIGSSDCAAEVHIHGCFADHGNCNEPQEHEPIHHLTQFAVHRAAYWLLLHVPCGASWRYSRFRIVRIAGDWWLPRWYSLGMRFEP